MSIQLIVFEIFINNPEGGIFLHSFKISVSILVEYNRCSDLHNCYLIVFVALFMLLNVSSLITHMLPFNPCLINCFSLHNASNLREVESRFPHSKLNVWWNSCTRITVPHKRCPVTRDCTHALHDCQTRPVPPIQQQRQSSSILRTETCLSQAQTSCKPKTAPSNSMQTEFLL